MGMLVSVLRADGRDCTLGGISSKAREICVLNVEGPFEPSEEHPAALLVMDRVLRIVPADANGQPTKSWTMMGGNFAHTSDSRFGEAIARLGQPGFYGAVAIHDRIEH